MGDGNDSMIMINFDEKGLVPVIAQDFTTKMC